VEITQQKRSRRPNRMRRHFCRISRVSKRSALHSRSRHSIYRESADPTASQAVLQQQKSTNLSTEEELAVRKTSRMPSAFGRYTDACDQQQHSVLISGRPMPLIGNEINRLRRSDAVASGARFPSTHKCDVIHRNRNQQVSSKAITGFARGTTAAARSSLDRWHDIL
jgi:hypothetical protein